MSHSGMLMHNQAATVTPATNGSWDEEMIVDARARVSPAEMVERKLVNLLRTTTMSANYRQSAARSR